MQTLQALDLTELRGADDLWRPRRRARHQADNLPGLPSDGFASPLGFWFAAAESWGTVVTPLRVQVFDPGEQEGAVPGAEGRSLGLGLTCRSYQARLRLNDKQPRSGESSSSLIVEINSHMARIEVAPESWTSVSEAVLIVVAQFWRFLAIDDLLDEIANWARHDLTEHGFIKLTHRRRLRELHAHRRELQALILDLPDFELFLTNPRTSSLPGRSIRLYRALARQLGLDRCRRAIDERVEVVEAVIDALAESLNHLQALAVQIVLEVVIVVLLLLDGALYVRDSMTR